MILGQWIATRPGRDETDMFPLLREAALHFGVTRPRLRHIQATQELAQANGIPWPADFWTWQGEVNLLALPEHVIGSNLQSYVLTGVPW